MTQPADANAAPESRESFFQQLQGLDNRFWIVNTMEMFERLAYYGVRGVAAIYMVLPASQGGPEFTHIQKGNIFAAWAAMQSLLPAFTGGFADRYGHKKTIAVAIALRIVGYLMMAHFKSYELFFAGCLFLAAGTAIFKPGVQGTLAATMKKENASVGWGMFYQLVNIGGFLGPVLAGVLRLMDWVYVFYACAFIVSINYLWLPFYQDPTQEEGYGDDEAQAARWANISQAVTPQLALGWARLMIGVSALWYLVAFVVPAIVAEQPDAMWMGIGVGGALLSGAVFALVGRGRAAELLLAAIGVATTVLLTIDADLAARGVLDTLGEGSALWSSLATFAFSGVYLAPTAAFFGAVLLAFVRRKTQLDEGRLDPRSVFVVSVAGLFQHRVFWFCVVFSGFWFMFNQVFDLLPNVMVDWVDSSGIILAMGEAFSGNLVPSLVAVLLAAAYAFVCGVMVLLAMRPDQRPTAEVPVPAYAVVAIALALASFFSLDLVAASVSTSVAEAGFAGTPLPNAVALLVFAVAGVALTAGVRAIKLRARWVSLLAMALALPVGAHDMRAIFLSSAPELVRMAEAGEQVNPEWMINLNPGLIVFTMPFVAYLTGFVSPLVSIVIGMVIATAGSVLAGTATVGWICLGGILIFSVGEMASSPKKMEYLATLAKKGQEGLFMGYANIPVAIGWIAGSIFAGNRYEQNGDKVNLAKKHLVEVQGWSQDRVDALDEADVVQTLATELGGTIADATKVLFETYHPERLWVDIALIGLASIVGMVVYGQLIQRMNKKAA